MKNELKALGYVDTRNYRYELDRHYDGSAYLSRIPMEINHLRYGKYCWISNTGDYFSVEVNCDGFVELAKCHSLAGAKLWFLG